MGRPNTTFCNGKCSVLAELYTLLAYYTHLKISQVIPVNISQMNLMINHEECSYSQKIKFMTSGETMRCRKVRRIFRYHVPKKFLAPENFAHHVLLLFYSFRNEK